MPETDMEFTVTVQPLSFTPPKVIIIEEKPVNETNKTEDAIEEEEE